MAHDIPEGSQVIWDAPHPHFSNVAPEMRSGRVVCISVQGNIVVQPDQGFDASSSVRWSPAQAQAMLAAGTLVVL